MTRRPLSPARTAALATRLELPSTPPICIACLGIVACEVEFGSAASAARAAREVTPWLWDEGLSEPALEAARRACARGVPDAHEGLADLVQRGGRSALARAIVLRLAEELASRTRAALALIDAARDRRDRASPDLS